MRGDGLRDDGYMYGTKVGCQDYGMQQPISGGCGRGNGVRQFGRAMEYCPLEHRLPRPHLKPFQPRTDGIHKRGLSI